ncbi:hypothetical protein GTY88_10720, partial [Streptomyces sp. SID5926]|nr:hypothetical protein [Streptomyces sp. SID5926]
SPAPSGTAVKLSALPTTAMAASPVRAAPAVRTTGVGRGERHNAYSSQQKAAASSATPTSPCSAACCHTAECGRPSGTGDPAAVGLDAPNRPGPTPRAGSRRSNSSASAHSRTRWEVSCPSRAAASPSGTRPPGTAQLRPVIRPAPSPSPAIPAPR